MNMKKKPFYMEWAYVLGIVLLFTRKVVSNNG